MKLLKRLFNVLGIAVGADKKATKQAVSEKSLIEKKENSTNGNALLCARQFLFKSKSVSRPKDFIIDLSNPSVTIHFVDQKEVESLCSPPYLIREKLMELTKYPSVSISL